MPAGPEAPAPRLVLGLQPVREAIKRHKQALHEVLIDQRAQPRLDALARFASDQGASVRRVPQSQLDRMSHGVQHQGAAALAPQLELVPLSALVAEPELLALALDEIQDPQNFGAVIRSAVGLGPAFVLWGEHASAPLTPATFRASAGAIEHASLCRVRSLTTALVELAQSAVQVVALDAHADVLLADLDLKATDCARDRERGPRPGSAGQKACNALGAARRPARRRFPERLRCGRDGPVRGSEATAKTQTNTRSYSQ